MNKPKAASSVTIMFTPIIGANFRVCVQQAVILAVTEDCVVMFIHNGRRITVSCNNVVEFITSTQEKIDEN